MRIPSAQPSSDASDHVGQLAVAPVGDLVGDPKAEHGECSEDQIDENGLPNDELAWQGSYRWVHWSLLLMSVGVIVLAIIMDREGESTVYVPFTSMAMPETCSMKRDFGVDCPGCGLTRAFISICEFRFLEAARFNPAAFFIFVMIAGQIPWRIIQLWRGHQGQRYLEATWFMWYVIFCAVILIGQWILRLLGVHF